MFLGGFQILSFGCFRFGPGPEIGSPESRFVTKCATTLNPKAGLEYRGRVPDARP